LIQETLFFICRLRRLTGGAGTAKTVRRPMKIQMRQAGRLLADTTDSAFFD
jgi:hypothetical protein